MNIKNFVGDLFGFTQEISNLKSVYESQLANMGIRVNKCEADYDKLEDKYLVALKALDNYEESEEAKYWNEKYPTANISYMGRTWGTSKDMIKIDVRLLITPQDYMIHDILKKHKLYLKDNNNDVDKTVIKIYQWIKRNYYKYIFDKNNYGQLGLQSYENVDTKKIHISQCIIGDDGFLNVEKSKDENYK